MAITDPVLDDCVRALAVLQANHLLSYGEVSEKIKRLAVICGASDSTVWKRLTKARAALPALAPPSMLAGGEGDPAPLGPVPELRTLSDGELYELNERGGSILDDTGNYVPKGSTAHKRDEHGKLVLNERGYAQWRISK